MALPDQLALSLGLLCGVVCWWHHLTSSLDHVTSYQQCMASCKKMAYYELLWLMLTVFVQFVGPWSNTKYWTILVFLHRNVWTFPYLLSMHISNPHIHVYYPYVIEIQVSMTKIPYPCVCHCDMHTHSNQPILLAYVLLSIISLFKSYPAIADITIPLALLCMWSHLFRCE